LDHALAGHRAELSAIRAVDVGHGDGASLVETGV
jgi:hypothetical protein